MKFHGFVLAGLLALAIGCQKADSPTDPTGTPNQSQGVLANEAGHGAPKTSIALSHPDGRSVFQPGDEPIFSGKVKGFSKDGHGNMMVRLAIGCGGPECIADPNTTNCPRFLIMPGLQTKKKFSQIIQIRTDWADRQCLAQLSGIQTYLQNELFVAGGEQGSTTFMTDQFAIGGP